jgi:glycogen debranching enzyme
MQWESLRQERFSPADTMFATTGRRIYVIGDIDGGFRPRSNPYDLYAFGRPQPDDPLANKLQGVWAQPVRGISRYGFTLEWGGETWQLEDATRFTQRYASVQFDFERGPLRAVRQDFAALDLPVLFSSLTIHNAGVMPLDLTVTFACEFDLADAWFTRLGPQRNTGETVSVEAGRFVARSHVAPERWAVAAGGERAPDSVRLGADGRAGELAYRIHLAPGGEETLAFGMAIESQDGPAAALNLLEDGLARRSALLAEKQALYTRLFERGPHFVCPDPLMNAAFDLARANNQALEAEQPGLGRYCYAGLEMFPFWFSDDGAYSVVGMLAGGLRETTLNHIRIGLDHLEGAGRVPHQISPSGRVAFPGNAQETPLWVMSIWDAYRWTGDRAFLSEMVPGALRGMFDYVLGELDADGDGYPSGPGMVEAEGMGAEKLDSAVYTWSALEALAKMADALGDAPHARQARERAGQIAARFDADWWDPQGGTYAMSLTDPGNQRYPVPHWAVIVPLEAGLATPAHAARTFETLRAQYLNRWGLKHTAGEDERVWTLPTATLSRAAYRYGEPVLGFEMLHHVAETLDHGSIGLFHELIPEGACFMQLWSGATFLRGVIEDLLGIQVDAAGHHVSIAPQLPATWEGATLEGLSFGEHTIDVRVTRQAIEVNQRQGSAPLSVECRLAGESRRSFQV